MSRLALRLMLVIASAAALAASPIGSGARPLAGSWQPLQEAPVKVDSGLAGAWTGRELIVSGVALGRSEDGAIRDSSNVAAAYDPARHVWRRLPTPPGPADAIGRHKAVWTGRELLVVSPFSTLAFDPATNRWRRSPRGAGGLVVWTGRELISWGGGCCGDAFNTGAAYEPTADRWRALARSPLAGSQQPVGAWTGRELLIFVGNSNPDGKLWPARLARAAAYNPATNRWRRIARMPEQRIGATAVWDGREALVVGGWQPGRQATAAVGFAYNPRTNRWRRLPRMERGRIGASVVWTGRRLLVWGGETWAVGSASANLPGHGLAYDPRTNRWSPLPPAPILGRPDPVGVWTGQSLLVWGGDPYRPYTDGAAFTPLP